jgi:hypothetical protein
MVKVVYSAITLFIGSAYYFSTNGNVSSQNYKLLPSDVHSVELYTVIPVAVGVNYGADTVTAINNTKDTIFVYPFIVN